MKNIDTIEKYIFYSMCGFFFANAVSVAAGNIFFVISLLLTLYRIWLKHDDLLDRFAVGKKWLRALGAFLIVVLLSCLASGDIVYCLKEFANFYVFRLMGFFIILISCREKGRLMAMMAAGGAGCLINCTMAIYAWFALGQRTGGFLPVMSLAGLLSMFVPVVVSLAILQKGKSRLLLAGLAFFLMVATVTNDTRGAWMAVVLTSAVAVCFALDSWKKRVSALLLSVMIVGGAVLSGGHVGKRIETIYEASGVSIAERFYLWQSAYNMFDDNKVLGVGFQRFRKLYKSEYLLPGAKNPDLLHAHSNLFHVLAECGGLGLLAAVIFWGQMIWFGIGGWLKTRQAPYLAFFCVVSGLLIQGLTEYNWGNAVVMKYFWCSLAVCMQLINIEGNS